MTSADIVVIGGGCTGASTAFHLMRRGARRVVLLEQKTAGSGPTAKSSGIIRLHYSYEPLIRLAARSRDVFSHFEEITGATADFRRTGFLLLGSHAQLPALKANVALQRSLGLQTCALSPEDVWLLDRRLELADVGGAAFEPDSGYADGYATVAGFTGAGRRLGLQLWESAPALRILVERNGRVRGVESPRGLIETPSVLVAAGPWTPFLVEPLGVRIPIRSTRQQVVQFGLPRGFGGLDMVCGDLIQGFYVRPETGETVLAGVLGHDREEEVPPDESNHGVDFDFVETLGRMWARRFPGAAEATVHGDFASLYDVTPDWQPILGPVDGVEGLFMAAGFSGHGFKLSPALGKSLPPCSWGRLPPLI
jgi:glycine/D-amino acid oxidase-like deaminating enzyme